MICVLAVLQTVKICKHQTVHTLLWASKVATEWPQRCTYIIKFIMCLWLQNMQPFAMSKWTVIGLASSWSVSKKECIYSTTSNQTLFQVFAFLLLKENSWVSNLCLFRLAIELNLLVHPELYDVDINCFCLSSVTLVHRRQMVELFVTILHRLIL